MLIPSTRTIDLDLSNCCQALTLYAPRVVVTNLSKTLKRFQVIVGLLQYLLPPCYPSVVRFASSFVRIVHILPFTNLILHDPIMALLKASDLGRYICAKGTVALLYYFCLSLAITILNKLLLQKVCTNRQTVRGRVLILTEMIKLKFPYLLTALHAGTSWLGSAMVLRNSKNIVRMQALRPVDHVKLVTFSILYSISIGISNVSM